MYNLCLKADNYQNLKYFKKASRGYIIFLLLHSMMSFNDESRTWAFYAERDQSISRKL